MECQSQLTEINLAVLRCLSGALTAVRAENGLGLGRGAAQVSVDMAVLARLRKHAHRGRREVAIVIGIAAVCWFPGQQAVR